jgi:hypothetical protein
VASVLTAFGRQTNTAILTGTLALPGTCGWGLNPQGITSSQSDVAMFQEALDPRVQISSVEIVTTATPNDTLKLIGTVSCTQSGGESIAEMDIVDAARPTSFFQGTVAAGSSIIGSRFGTGLNLAPSYSGLLSTVTNGCYLQLDTGEVVQVSAGGGTLALTLTGGRGANGSTALSTAAIGTNVTIGSAPGATATTGTQLFVHGDFTAVPVTLGQSIEFIVNINFV